jgi:hypothetical protein
VGKFVDVKVDDRGFEAIRRRVEQNIVQVVQDALNEVAQQVLDRSQDLVPVKTGALRDSGYITSGEQGGYPSVTITYGGGDVPYAYKVHEDLEMRHPNGGQAKFLEQAFIEYEQVAIDTIQQRVLQLFKGQ